MDRRESRLGPLLIAGAVTVCLAIAAYAASYALICDVQSHPHVKFRTYRTRVQAELYKPAAQVESALLGIPIELRHASPSGPPTPLAIGGCQARVDRA